jgi:putative SOS response-associated peptidase YedK
MCGRFTLANPGPDLFDAFGLPEPPFDLRPRYNIAPTQEVLSVLPGEEGRRWALLRWGLIPFWAKDPAIGNRLINARAETVAEKPAFRRAFERGRCLVVADGFYEWTVQDGRKQPIHLRLPGGRAFAFAALRERWQPARGEAVRSCALLTTAASPAILPIHDRMPVILSPAEAALWLDPEASRADLLGLLQAHAGAELESYPVSAVVNSPRNDGPECLDPVAS